MNGIVDMGCRHQWSGIRASLSAILGTFILLGGLLPRRALAAAPEARPNVIVITLDTVRADHLGCYGYSRIQTPHIDGLARPGTVFAHAYTPVPVTLPAHAALFTGSFPMVTGIHDFSGNKLSPSTVTLAKILHDNSYTTAAFIGAAVLDSRFGLDQGFDTYFDNFEFRGLEEAHLDRMERRGDQVTDEALNWLEHQPRQPFFLWVHLYDAHDPYTPPEPYATRYRARPYDGEIAFVDAQVGRLVAFLKQRGLFEKTMFVLAGDHGESLGEHGEKTHGFFIYNSTLHVPLIFKIPGIAPRVVENEVSLVDVMPTVLDAVKVSVPASVQGRSLLSQILGRRGGGTSNLYAENYLPLLHFRWSQLRSLQSGGLKYIDAPRPELYDTRTDPRELKNLYSQRRSVANEMRDRLFRLLRRFTPGPGGPRGERELTDPVLLERLKSLGYVAVSAGTFAEASGEALPDPKDRIQVYELVSEATTESQQGNYQASLRKLGEAEKTEPQSVTIQYLSALNYFHLKDYRRAIEHFRSVLQLQPDSALTSYYLGLSQLEFGDLDGAESSFTQALDLDPTNFTAAYNLGVVYTRRKRAGEAIQAFQRAVRILPEYAEAHEALGELYLYQNRLEDAVRELERAVALNPEMRKAHHHLGRAYRALGRNPDAEREFERANPR